MNREVNASASTPGVEELGSLGAANASTFGPTSAGTTIDAAEQMMHEAEEASLRSLHAFTSYWTSERRNAFASMEASMFEMVLQSTLSKHYGLDAQQIETIMRDRRPKGKGEDKGGASTPARGKGGKGGGKGGRGGKGGWGGKGGVKGGRAGKFQGRGGS